MGGEHAARTTRSSREWRVSAGLIVLVVLFRSAVLVWWPLSDFDSDQAIIGLMAKHLAELRAFPLFFYGQNYMLGVEAWLAAPVFLIAGASVTSLRLPLLGINIAIALLLFRTFGRDTGLRPALAAIPTLFVALAAPATSARLLETNGGNVEPLLYVLLLWLTRHRPRWCGFVFAIGFLQREFVLYGFVALLLLEAFQKTLLTREGLIRRAMTLRTAAVTWLTVQWLKSFSSAAGPGTTMLDVFRPHDNLTELVGRVCLDVRTLPLGIWRLMTIHWPALFGMARQPVADFGIDTTVTQGLPAGSIVLAAVLLIPLIAVVLQVTKHGWRPQYNFCAYLVATGLLSCAGYVVARCGEIGYMLMRYELLSLLGAAGLGAWGLAASPPWARWTWAGVASLVFATSAVAHGRILAQYLAHPPASAKLAIARQLEARGVRYATSDYWIAYAVTFLTDEKTKIASTDLVRVREYNRLADAHPDETIRIAREACPGGHRIMEGVYFCR